jgi:S1-C subfamily serine protease
MKKSLTVLTAALGLTMSAVSQARQSAHHQSTNRDLKYTQYKLADGTVVEMSRSQKLIANNQARQFSPSELYRYGSQMVVTVFCDLGNGQQSQGTGFFIDANTILTNWHVVRNAKFISMATNDRYKNTRYENGTVVSDNQYYNGTIVSSSPSLDVACVRFDSAQSRGDDEGACMDTDSNWEQIGDPVYVIGTPQGLGQTLSTGILSGRRANGALFQLTAPVTHGSSGSPVFNQYGLIIGIISRSLSSDGGELNIAISTNAILEALKVITVDHPNGFNTGITKGLELRSKAEIDEDNKVATPTPSQTPLEDDPIFKKAPTPSQTPKQTSTQSLPIVAGVTTCVLFILVIGYLFIVRCKTPDSGTRGWRRLKRALHRVPGT